MTEESTQYQKEMLSISWENVSPWTIFHHLAVDPSFQMMTVGMGVMRLDVYIPALITNSVVPVADVSQTIGPVMVTMTVETSVMKSIAPEKVSNFVNQYQFYIDI